MSVVLVLDLFLTLYVLSRHCVHKLSSRRTSDSSDHSHISRRCQVHRSGRPHQRHHTRHASQSSPQMNLGRYTVSTPANPAYASVSFTESVPAPVPLKIARKNVSDQNQPPTSRKGKEREAYRPAAAVLEPVTDGQEPRKKRRRNGTFVVAGEEGFEVWSNQPQLRLLLRRSK